MQLLTQKGGEPPFCKIQLFNDEGLELIVELCRTNLGFVCELYGLAKIEAENTENRLAVYLVLSGFKVYVSFKTNENIDQFVYVIDLSKLNVKCHNMFPFLKLFIPLGYPKYIIYHLSKIVNSHLFHLILRNASAIC